MGLPMFHPEVGQIEVAYRGIANDSSSSILSHDSNLEKLSCTVAFINKRLSMTRCKRSCTSMGANFYRWFHEGCCECIGRYCLNYGLDRPKCMMDEL